MQRSGFTRRDALKAIGATGIAGLAGCANQPGQETDPGTTTGESTETTQTTDVMMENVRAAFMYISEVGDLGWSWAHDQGRQKVDEKLDWLETDYTESLAPSDSTRVIKQYTQGDYDILFGTTFEYMDPMHEVATENPGMLYEHCSGYKRAPNMGRYFGKMYQARFLAGVAAGMVTEANQLGYVAAFPTPEVVRGINAFAHGAATVNEDVTTKVRWVNSWFDPPSEREAANALIDEGVDVMGQHQDSPAAVKAAASADIWATGYDAPMGQHGGEKYITSPIWHWEVFYEPTLKAVREGTWTSDFYFKGLNAGIVDLDDWGPNVPSDVKSTVEDKRTQIEDGELDPWAGTKFEDESQDFLFEDMKSYVESVEGTVPN